MGWIERAVACAVGPVLLASASAFANGCGDFGGTGDLGVVIEREAGSLQVIDTTDLEALCRVEGLGDLSHASVVYGRDERFAYVFGRDGGLSKVDVLSGEVAARVIQAGNAIGGAISQDGRLVAVSNYEPGGVRVFDTGSLDLIVDIPTKSKVVGLVDAPGNRFVFSLYDAGEIWIADLSNPAEPAITRFQDVGLQPYDGLITPDGRYYLAGLFGEDGIAMLDLWRPEQGVQRILDGYGRGEAPLPVYKMPHLEGWAAAGDVLVLPAVGRHELLLVDRRSFEEVGRIEVQGQPVFAVARPDGRQVWVTFAHPNNDVVQVVDVPARSVVRELAPGEAVLHLEFTARGDQVWVSARDSDRVVVYDPQAFQQLASVEAHTPSGIFMTARAHRIGL